MGELFKKKEIIEENKAEIKSEINKQTGDTGVRSIIRDLNSKDLLKGMILSEILGKPLSKRRRKR
jgi:hypothetical protein